MPSYSDKSMEKLSTCSNDLIRVCIKVIDGWDNTVLCGHRPEGEQMEAFNSKRSKVRWPNSAHNKFPAMAVDLAPYGCWGPDRPKIVWPDHNSPTYLKDVSVWYYFAGYVLGVAADMGIKLRHGGDWNQNRRIDDQHFDDLPHFELRE